jgi:hypothetical protein
MGSDNLPAVYEGGYTLTNSIVTAREGPRIDHGNINISDCYIEVQGKYPDHGDGMQAYMPGGSSVVVMKRVHIKMLPNNDGNNCGFFLADDSRVDLTMEDVLIEDVNSPNGAIWMRNFPGEFSVTRINWKNVEIRHCIRGIAGLEVASGGQRPIIDRWENVIVDGKLIPKPF